MPTAGSSASSTPRTIKADPGHCLWRRSQLHRPSDGLTVISIPQTFQFTSFVGNYKTGTAITVPLSLWTTLDDIVVRAYLGGLHRVVPATHSLTDSSSPIDPLFEKHVTSTSWTYVQRFPFHSPRRPSRFVMWCTRDARRSSQPDRPRQERFGKRDARSVITAVTVLQVLERDAVADGQFDGLSGATQLKTSGNPQQSVDASWLRYAMAQALDEWFKGTTNKTGLTSSDVQNAGVFDTIAGDTSMLFPRASFRHRYDNIPPA